MSTRARYRTKNKERRTKNPRPHGARWARWAGVPSSRAPRTRSPGARHRRNRIGERDQYICGGAWHRHGDRDTRGAPSGSAVGRWAHRSQCAPPNAVPDGLDVRPPGWSSNRVVWASLRGRRRCRATLPSSWPRCRRPRWEDRRRDSRSHRRSPENRFRSSPREPLREDRCRVRL